MANVWSTNIVLPAGSTASKQAWVGPPERKGASEQVSESVPALVGTLRVGYLGNMYSPTALPVRCDVGLPDNGIVLAGVDLPLVLTVPLPAHLTVYALEAQPQDLQLVASAFGDVDSSSSWGATQSVSALAAAVIPLMPWCQAVSLHDVAATATWQDALGAAIGVFSGYRPRPRRAVSILVGGTATMVTQHFST